MHKPKLHKETGLKIKRKIKKKKEARMNTLKQKAPRLDFLPFPSVKSITVNKHVISNLKLKGLGPEKVPIKIN